MCRPLDHWVRNAHCHNCRDIITGTTTCTGVGYRWDGKQVSKEQDLDLELAGNKTLLERKQSLPQRPQLGDSPAPQDPLVILHP